jgi:hypothetical protein
MFDTIGNAKLYLNDALGRKFFHNTVRFSDNLVGKSKLSLFRLFFPITGHEVTYSKKLREFGYVEMGPHEDQDLLNEVADQAANMFQDEREFSFRGNGKYAKQLDTGQIPQVYNLLNDDIITILESYYKCSFDIVEKRSKIYRTTHVPPEIAKSTEAYSNYWHCDRHTPDMVKMFIYLTDVTERNGPFTYVDRTATRRLVENYDFSNSVRSELGVPGNFVESRMDVQRFTGPSGSIAICDTQNCLHRAGVPSHGEHRDLVTFQFAPSRRHIRDNPNVSS